jgi:single-strand DNA-binding protein
MIKRWGVGKKDNMAFSINRAVLVGNMTQDVELKYTPSGNAVASINIATNRSVKKDDAWEDVPTFHRVVVWGKLAEYLANAVHKGDKVYVDGRIENRKYDDKDGITRYVSEVVAANVIPMVSKRTVEAGKSDKTAKEPGTVEGEEPEIEGSDDLPF